MTNSRRRFKIISASVTGLTHLNNNLPCQDYCRHRRGKNLVAVLSDGAGSAKYGRIGARVLCNKLCDILADADFSGIEDEIKKAIETARQILTIHRLNGPQNETGLDSFAATVVGVVYNHNKGIFFHIGDGAALSLHDDYFRASRPENGCCSCETFFFTQKYWKSSLRFTRFANAEAIFLMSDGVTSFAFQPDLQDIEHRFILPIHNFLSAEKNTLKASRSLFNTLSASKAQHLNPDDKTLMWIKVS